MSSELPNGNSTYNRVDTNSSGRCFMCPARDMLYENQEVIHICNFILLDESHQPNMNCPLSRKKTAQNNNHTSTTSHTQLRQQLRSNGKF